MSKKIFFLWQWNICKLIWPKPVKEPLMLIKHNMYFRLPLSYITFLINIFIFLMVDFERLKGKPLIRENVQRQINKPAFLCQRQGVTLCQWMRLECLLVSALSLTLVVLHLCVNAEPLRSDGACRAACPLLAPVGNCRFGSISATTLSKIEHRFPIPTNLRFVLIKLFIHSLYDLVTYSQS